MRKVIVIAVREYLAAVRTKSFLISLVIIPLLMGGSILIQALVHQMEEHREKRYAVIDRTPGEKVGTLLVAVAKQQLDSGRADLGLPGSGAYTIELVEPAHDQPDGIEQQRFALSERVRAGSLQGFLEIGPDVLAPPDAGPGQPLPDSARVRFQTKGGKLEMFPRWAEAVINEAVQQSRGAQAGLKPAELAAILRRVPVSTLGLSRREPASGRIEEASEETQLATLLVPVSLVGLMFMIIMIGATPLMHGIIEEKMQRIAEVLLGSVGPFQLMMGKLLGMGAVSLTVVAVYLGGAYWAAARYGFLDLLPLPLLLWFLGYVVLAMVMYGSLFVAIGAACTDMKDAQTLVLPVALLACLPMFFMQQVMTNPHGDLVTIMSLFPFATPMLMVARQALPPGVPWWQALAGIVGVLAATTACVYAAGRIFRVGILMQGKGARISDLVRWVIRG